MPNAQTGHIAWDDWIFDYGVWGWSGLALLNGSYRGIKVFAKLSMPVIRVKYLRDACGPYADRIRWKLGGDHGLQKVGGRGNNEYVVCAPYSSGGMQYLEIAIYARIGAYHLYQAWVLTDQGQILPRIWSKGLSCNVDHTHHIYWRLDFDIDGSASNRVNVIDNNSWFYYPNESNDVKNPVVNRVWVVRHLDNKHSAWITPGVDDGVADDFSGIDMAARLFHVSEDEDWPFGTNGLGYLNGEAVGSADVVFWYIAHLSHHAHDGAAGWHSAGPSIQLVGF